MFVKKIVKAIAPYHVPNKPELENIKSIRENEINDNSTIMIFIERGNDSYAFSSSPALLNKNII